MPQFIAAAAVVVGNFAAGEVLAVAGLEAVGTAALVGTVVTGLTEVAIYGGLSWALNAAFAPKPPPLGAVDNPLKQSLPDRQSGFGRTRLSGPYMLYEAGRHNAFLVIALHDGEIDGFEAFYLNDDLCVIDGATRGVYSTDKPTRYGGGPPGHKIHWDVSLGPTPNTAFTRPIDPLIDGLWDATCRGDGVAGICLRVEQSKLKDQQHDFPNGLPQASVVARLQKVFDPRLGEDQADPATYAWAANPVLALLTYLTDAPGGMGLSYARRIEPALAAWTAAAEDCDLPIALLNGGTEPRYACGGVYKHSSAPADVVGQLVQSFDGWLSQRGDGALVVQSGRYVAPTVVIRDEHVVAYSVQHFQPDEQSTNEIVPSYSDPTAKFNKVDAGAWRDEDDIAARGIVRSDTLDLPWVQSPSQARRLAKRKMSRSAAERRGTITTNLYGFTALGERYLRLRITENASLADLAVEVSNVEMDLAAMQVTFAWVEADEDIDAWNRFSEEQPMPSAAEPTGDPGLEQAVIDSATIVYQTTAADSQGARISVVVEQPVNDLQWIVRWRPVGSDDWLESDFSDVADGATATLLTGFVAADVTLEVQAAYVTAGGQSPWSASVFVAVPIAPLTAFEDEGGLDFLDEAGLRFYPEA